MAKGKRRHPRVKSPKGVSMYPWLNKPDTKFDEDGVYKVDLKVAEADAKPFVEQLEAIYEEHYQKQLVEQDKKKLKKAPLPWKMEEDDDGDETGNVIFRFKVNAVTARKGKDPWDRRPKLFDAAGTPIDLTVGGGSILKIISDAYCWFSALGVGMSLQPVAVQVIQLAEFGGGSADDFGIEKEDGFEVGDESEPVSAGADKADNSDDDDDLF